MRNAFADEVTTLAASDPRITLLSGDIGNRMFDTFKEKNSGRFFNCGIAEANMMGTAAGMALSGLRPIIYTIAPFTTSRCYEQIRVDACYHCLPIIIVGTGAGLTYAELGPTHHSCEDLAMMRILPNMTVLAPADEIELRQGLRAALQLNSPIYIRIGKKGEPIIAKKDTSFKLGHSITVRDGTDICLIGTGTLLPVVLQAADLLTKQNITARVESFHTIKPLDLQTLFDVFSTYSHIAVIEEHSRLGGLSSSIAEWLATQSGLKGKLIAFGTDDQFMQTTGSQDYARAHFGLTAENIASQIIQQTSSSCT